ncbi:MAG: bifunctional UDP-N-acetylglucosamine diphosphorylase/glucosamine-1-phosphate N-acetyltransferase GlmU [Micrococcales bacterium]
MPQKHLAVVVLAAGQGTRMKSATPKVMHNLAGLPLLGHVLVTAKGLDPQHVIPVIRHEKESIAEYIETFHPGCLVVEQDEIPGTGRAVECAIAALPDDFNGAVVVTSGDVPLLDVLTLEALLEEHIESGAAATILTAIMDDPTGYGRIVRHTDGSFDSIVEQRDANDDQLEILEINAGVYVFDAVALRESLAKVGTHNAQGEKYLTDVAKILVDGGSKVLALAVEDNWLVAGINDRQQLSEVAGELNARICEFWQLEGVSIIDPASTWIDVTVQIDADATILPGTYLHGFTKIGGGATVGPEVVMLDTEVGPGASVVKAHVTGSRIGEGASVGPFAYLRPGTDLGKDGKIGTFVETKNAKIGEGTKVPHLTYVGDAEIGEHSNIGAGTIFANYDGIHKHRSTIGSHVKTGAHNVFVAPISIADGAYTAAGSVIRRDVAAGALGMSVTPQKNLPDWVLQKRAGTASAEAAQKAKD